jgi:hypothetical protein
MVRQSKEQMWKLADTCQKRKAEKISFAQVKQLQFLEGAERQYGEKTTKCQLYNQIFCCIGMFPKQH